jgi:hypothetical protein
MIQKEVYILGAGFSIDGGAPKQKNILQEIYNLKNTTSKFYKKRKDLFSFLKILFPLEIKDIIHINLEDIFTILDKAIINDEFIQDFSPKELREKKKLLNYCTIFTFKTLIDKTDRIFYDELSGILVNLRIAAQKDGDPFSIINLNWDTILDNSLDSATEEYNNTVKLEDSCFVDYCTYTNFFEGMKFHISSSKIKAMGYYNVKMLKLHGSFNWLICSNCNRLFVNSFYSQLLEVENNSKIRFDCMGCQIENSFKSALISPTLLKDLNNVHLKLIWHNTGIELMEAKKIIFVGYSFPLADYDFRYLLKKSIRTNADIEIVLLDDEESKLAFERYKLFFGSRIKVEYKNGCESYFRSKFNF